MAQRAPSAKGIGMRIREARGKTNQQAFAVRVGASVRAVQYWESGRVSPRTPQLRAIARATGQPLEFFLQDEDDEEADEIMRDLWRSLRRAVAHSREWNGVDRRRGRNEADRMPLGNVAAGLAD